MTGKVFVHHFFCYLHPKSKEETVLKKSRGFALVLLYLTLIVGVCNLHLTKVYAVDNTPVVNAESQNTTDVIHAFYPSNAEYSEQIRKYIDSVDSLSFAWGMLEAERPEVLNVTKGQNGNYSFYYPEEYLLPIKYAKSQHKPLQISIFMEGSDGTLLLPYAEKRSIMIQAIVENLQKDISQGEGLYFDGVVIDFEGLRDLDNTAAPLLYEGKRISTYFTEFLAELKTKLEPMEKKLYVAVSPRVYFDGYDYKSIMGIADRVILMAHDYEPTDSLQKHQVMQYIDYGVLDPVDSLAPIGRIRQALKDFQESVDGSSDMSKVWLQIAFDSAQWRYDITGPDKWKSLEGSALSKGSRFMPLYKAIKARIDNADGYGVNITYGYNNQLQSAYMQYYRTLDKTWNVILYEDSKSIGAKIDLAKAYGLGGISVWNLGNVPDYNDEKGKVFHLDGWSTILAKVKEPYIPAEGGNIAIKFADKILEQAVRERLYKPTGAITLKDVKSIYRLKLPVTVKTLSDLKNFTNLEYLDAQGLNIKDITALGSLTNLRFLYLQRNQIVNISALRGLTKLEILDLSNNGIVDIQALKNLKNLEVLYIQRNSTSNIQVIAALTKLKELSLNGNKVSDIRPLAGLTKLELLYLKENKIISIAPLANLVNLRQLSLDYNQISDIGVLSKLLKLQELYLPSNKVVNLTPLKNLKSLKILSLNRNYVKDIKVLTGLTSLEKLYLKDNKIVSAAPLKKLTKLKELYLSGNVIRD